MDRQDWEGDQDYMLAEANYKACAYNAAVNHGTQRGIRKMGDLIRAINYYERVKGTVKLRSLVKRGLIDSFSPCADACEIRPGGLFHVPGCENDANHPAYRARMAVVVDRLPAKESWSAAVSLVGGA